MLHSGAYFVLVLLLWLGLMLASTGTCLIIKLLANPFKESA